MNNKTSMVRKMLPVSTARILKNSLKELLSLKPKPGVKQAAEQESQASIQFRQARRKHSGIESAIGALQSGNALAKCRDQSQVGYARYIGLGILGRNLLILGKLLLAREQPDCLAASNLRNAA